MDTQIVFAMVSDQAKKYGADPDLALAIATVESNGNQYAVRFEPNWKYFVTISTFAQANLITTMTEQVLQQCSWGPMQIMGSVVRELGYQGPLAALTDPAIALKYSMAKLKKLCDLYEDESALIAAYNAGTPRKNPDGKYENQAYVDKVSARLKVLRRLG